MKVVDSSKRSERSWWTPDYLVGVLGAVIVAGATVLIVVGISENGDDVPAWVGFLAYGAAGWFVVGIVIAEYLASRGNWSYVDYRFRLGNCVDHTIDIHTQTMVLRRHRRVAVDGVPVSLESRNLRPAARYEFTFGSDPAHRAAISHVPHDLSSGGQAR
jgi:hypothetical protein